MQLPLQTHAWHLNIFRSNITVYNSLEIQKNEIKYLRHFSQKLTCKREKK